MRHARSGPRWWRTVAVAYLSASRSGVLCASTAATLVRKADHGPDALLADVGDVLTPQDEARAICGRDRQSVQQIFFEGEGHYAATWANSS